MKIVIEVEMLCDAGEDDLWMADGPTPNGIVLHVRGPNGVRYSGLFPRSALIGFAPESFQSLAKPATAVETSTGAKAATTEAPAKPGPGFCL